MLPEYTDHIKSPTIQSLFDIYNRLPPPPSRMSLVIPVQAKINSQISQQMEVVRSQFLPRPEIRYPRRRDYNTRAGYRMARAYWRGRERRMRRGEIYVGWLLSEAASKRESDFFWHQIQRDHL